VTQVISTAAPVTMLATLNCVKTLAYHRPESSSCAGLRACSRGPSGAAGGATLDNEENYLIKKLFTALSAIENQTRI
jgi:hypothetical protein